MKKFILKIVSYIFLILVALEIIVRIFHLYTEDPPRYIDEYGVEKRIPGHKGYAVTGNRNQNFSEFNINSSGFNSFREFTPTIDKFEIAIIGDSFIEGFHQNYYNSTGKKVEDKLQNVEVYEYGYAGYDLANQMHLINSYKKEFEKIDEIIIYLNYENDLQRGTYAPNRERISMLSSTVFKIRDNIKLLAYGSKIGILEPIKKIITGKSPPTSFNTYESNATYENLEERKKKDFTYLNNFKKLVDTYGFDKTKTTILLNSKKTSPVFLNYCNNNNIQIIDFFKAFEKSKTPTTLIYDRHWNTNGRSLIANEIVSYMNLKKK